MDRMMRVGGDAAYSYAATRIPVPSRTVRWPKAFNNESGQRVSAQQNV